MILCCYLSELLFRSAVPLHMSPSQISIVVHEYASGTAGPLTLLAAHLLCKPIRMVEVDCTANRPEGSLLIRVKKFLHTDGQDRVIHS